MRHLIATQTVEKNEDDYILSSTTYVHFCVCIKLKVNPLFLVKIINIKPTQFVLV